MSDTHAGDRALSHVLGRFHGIYGPLADDTAKLISAFLEPHRKALRRRDHEKKLDYYMRFMLVFSGVKWALVRRKIARLATDANRRAADAINEWLEQAFMDGMNNAAFTLSLSGADAFPVTESVITQLIAWKLVNLQKRQFKNGKDSAYNEHQIQSAIHAAIYSGIMFDQLAEYAADRIAAARENEARAAAQAAVYSASDSGAYYAGLEAQKGGLDVEKTWLSIMDMRVRPSHSHLNNTTIPLDEVFHGYHGDLRYPHDPDAPPAERYNCRCRMVVHLAGRPVAKYNRNFLLPTQTTAYRKWRDEQIRKAGTEIELARIHKRRLSR